MKTSQFKDVWFSFVCAVDDPSKVPGEVVVRPGEMALDVDAFAYPTPYTITGKWQNGYYAGKAHERPVSAKWIELDGRFIGSWVEEGIDTYLPSVCPRTRTRLTVLQTPRANRHPVARRIANRRGKKPPVITRPQQQPSLARAINR